MDPHPPPEVLAPNVDSPGVVAIGQIPDLPPERLERGDGDPSRALTLEREVIFDVGGLGEPVIRQPPREPRLDLGTHVMM